MIAIKKIKTKKNNYIYDVFNNKILKVDSKIFNVFNEEIDFKEIDNKKVIDLAQKKYFKDFPLEIDNFEPNRNEKTEDLRNLILNITENCNFRCKYCLYGDAYNHLFFRKHSQKKMNFNIAQKAINYFFKYCIKKNLTVTFLGGEPLLEYYLIEKIINYVNINYSNIKVIYQICTNASLLTKDMINLFSKNNVILDISIDGPSSIHDKYRVDINGKKTLTKVLSKIRMIKNDFPSYFKSNVRFYVTYSFSEYFNDLITFFSNNSELFPIKKIVLNELIENEMFHNEKKEKQNYKYIKNYSVQAYKKVLDNHKLKNSSIIKERLSYHDEFIFKFTTMSLSRIHNLINKKKIINRKIHPNGCCVPGRAALSVSTSGNYHYCSQVNLSESTIIGNIDNGIMVSKVNKLLKKYEKISLSNCKNCWAVNLCGLCFASIHDGFSLSKELKDKKCITYRKYLFRNLIFYCELMEKDKTILEYSYDN